VRPQLFTILLVLLFDRLLFERVVPKTPAGWLAAVAGAALAVNLHGVGLLLPILYGLVVLGGVLRRRIVRGEDVSLRGPLLLLLALSLATLATPNGLAIHRYALEASSFGRKWITEWLPLTFDFTRGTAKPFARIAAAGLFGVGLAAVGGLFERRGLRGALETIHPSRLLLFAASAFFAARAMKFLWLGYFAIDLSLRAGRALASPAPLGRPASLARRLAAWACLPAALALALPLLRFPALARAPGEIASGAWFGTHVNPVSVPVEAARFAREAGIEGRLFNFYGWGGFLIVTLGERCPVFVDGRMFEYGEGVFVDGFALRDWPKSPEHLSSALEVVERRGIEVTIFDPRWCPPGGCQGAGWTLVYRDEVAAIFVRAATENERRARALLERAPR
jgi:hypothetical protein